MLVKPHKQILWQTTEHPLQCPKTIRKIGQKNKSTRVRPAPTLFTKLHAPHTATTTISYRNHLYKLMAFAYCKTQIHNVCPCNDYIVYMMQSTNKLIGTHSSKNTVHNTRMLECVPHTHTPHAWHNAKILCNKLRLNKIAKYIQLKICSKLQNTSKKMLSNNNTTNNLQRKTTTQHHTHTLSLIHI